MTATLAGPHFITTAPGLTACRRCGAPVLAATVGGLDRHITPAPLDPTGELAALLAGRATYSLTRRLLTRRTVHHIRGARPTLVVADHTCGAPAGFAPPVLAEAGVAQHTAVEEELPCPF